MSDGINKIGVKAALLKEVNQAIQALLIKGDAHLQDNRFHDSILQKYEQLCLVKSSFIQ